MHWLHDLQMTQKILEAEGEGDPVQLDFFLKGNLALEKNPRRKPHSWIPDQVRFATYQGKLAHESSHAVLSQMQLAHPAVSYHIA